MGNQLPSNEGAQNDSYCISYMQEDHKDHKSLYKELCGRKYDSPHVKGGIVRPYLMY